MPTNHQRLMTRILKRTKLSPEAFAMHYAPLIAHYSARTVRRWAHGTSPIPKYVALALTELNALLVAKENRSNG